MNAGWATTCAAGVTGGVVGFDLIMRVQTWITGIGVALTAVYLVLVLDRIDLGAATALPSGTTAGVVGAIVLVATATGLGWINAAADYSRYLPRGASTFGVAAWTTAGLSVASLVLIGLGLLLAVRRAAGAAAVAGLVRAGGIGLVAAAVAAVSGASGGTLVAASLPALVLATLLGGVGLVAVLAVLDRGELARLVHR